MVLAQRSLVQVIVQPEDGLTPILKAIKRARKSLDIVIFRFDQIGRAHV